MSDYKIFSADSHVSEPGDLWVERIDTRSCVSGLVAVDGRLPLFPEPPRPPQPSTPSARSHRSTPVSALALG